jgi:hypothetical protein
LGESCVTASGGRKRRALGGHASSLLISGQEDASSKWRASHSAVVELSTSQRRVKRWDFGRSGASDVDRADAHED